MANKKFQPVWQSRQQALRAYCPIYILCCTYLNLTCRSDPRHPISLIIDVEYLYRNPKKPASKSFETLCAIQGFLAFVPKYESKIEKTKKKPKSDMKCNYF